MQIPSFDIEYVQECPYSSSDLQGNTVKNLQKLAEKHGFSKSGTKPELIERIQLLSGITDEEREQILEASESSSFSDNNRVTKFYKENFNYVDRNDKRSNMLDTTRKKHDYKTKFFFMVLKNFILNAWAYMNITCEISLEDFRDAMIEAWKPMTPK